MSKLLERVGELSPAECRRYLRLLGDPAYITEQERVFVAEYAVYGKRTAAAAAAGYKSPAQMGKLLLEHPRHLAVQNAVRDKLAERERVSTLKAEWVREYIQSVLDLCPTDYFVLAADGDWVIDPDEFAELPVSVKRLVESVEMKLVAGRRFYRIQFISKTAALRLAAQYTLTQKISASVTVLPWDQIAGLPPPEAEVDPIEARIASVGRDGGAGSAAPSSDAVAGRYALPPAARDRP